MSYLGPISALVAALGFAVLVGYLIPVLVNLRKSTASLAAMLQGLAGRWESILDDLKGVTGNLVTTSKEVSEAAERLVKVLSVAGTLGRELEQAEEFVEHKVRRFLANLSLALSKGSDWVNRILHWRGKLRVA